jgi:ABC-type glycerol-3-phosphate transport system substrate-binding protein
MVVDNSGGNPSEDQRARLFQPALQELKTRHPALDININYVQSPYNQTRTHILNALGNQTPVDIISLDQVWFGEFAQKGYLTDITNRVQSWGRISDWYPTNFAGGVYNGKVYAIWAWTDVRGIWYWKDLLNRAQVNPNSLMTWDGYISSSKKISEVKEYKVRFLMVRTTPQIFGTHTSGRSEEISLYRRIDTQQRALTGFQHIIALQVLKHWNSSKNKLMQVLNQ